MNKFTIGKQSVEGIFLVLLENLTIVPSCFSLWIWVDWGTFPLSWYANTLDTDSVPMEPLFAVPRDIFLHGVESSRFRLTLIARRCQLDNNKKKQGNVNRGRFVIIIIIVVVVIIVGSLTNWPVTKQAEEWVLNAHTKQSPSILGSFGWEKNNDSG